MGVSVTIAGVGTMVGVSDELLILLLLSVLLLLFLNKMEGDGLCDWLLLFWGDDVGCGGVGSGVDSLLLLLLLSLLLPCNRLDDETDTEAILEGMKIKELVFIVRLDPTWKSANEQQEASISSHRHCSE